jgi:hypothetical protein
MNLVSVTASLGAGETAGAAGTVSINLTTNRVEASTSNVSTTADSTGAISLSARDHSAMVVIAAALAAGLTAGFGGGLAYNDIANTITSFITGSTITTNGNLSVLAVSNENMLSVSAGAAGSENIAVGGGLSLVQMANAINADIDTASNVHAASAAVIALDNSSIGSAVVGAALSLDLAPTGTGVAIAVSVSFATNQIDDSVTADVQNSKVATTAGSVDVEAGESSNISAASAAASIAVAGGEDGGLALSGAGALATNVILGAIQAYIMDRTVTSAASIKVNATNIATINALIVSAAVAGAGGAGGGAALAVGASYADNLIGYDQNNTKMPVQVWALINNSTVVVSGAVSINATTAPQLNYNTSSGTVAVQMGDLVQLGSA